MPSSLDLLEVNAFHKLILFIDERTRAQGEDQGSGKLSKVGPVPHEGSEARLYSSGETKFKPRRAVWRWRVYGRCSTVA